MKVFKLKKAPPAKSNAKTAADNNARRKFLNGLEELRRVTSLEEYHTAKEAGVEFSIDGFRRRVHIGNQAMRTTHSELFDELKAVLKFVHEELLRVPKNAKGRSRVAPRPDGRSDAEKKVEELEALLDRRERDFLDLLKELRLLRSQA
ncbi:hypothetical protein [Rhizobium binae]|uniref:hypothetical protein n=1 Tax=Rhizobium binae TaxID=1138190 RepID=UPI001C83FB54|nr:hypothetical protein [Rhizobium binae]MBX4961377.1 hypothetical protein [Rhizobium binae]